MRSVCQLHTASNSAWQKLSNNIRALSCIFPSASFKFLVPKPPAHILPVVYLEFDLGFFHSPLMFFFRGVGIIVETGRQIYMLLAWLMNIR